MFGPFFLLPFAAHCVTKQDLRKRGLCEPGSGVPPGSSERGFGAALGGGGGPGATWPPRTSPFPWKSVLFADGCPGAVEEGGGLAAER